jgi:hypothetical protein
MHVSCILLPLRYFVYHFVMYFSVENRQNGSFSVEISRFNPEDGGDMFLQNVSICLQDYMVS